MAKTGGSIRLAPALTASLEEMGGAALTVAVVSWAVAYISSADERNNRAQWKEFEEARERDQQVV